MIKKILAIITASLLAGCTSISVESPQGYKIKIFRCLSDVHVQVRTENGSLVYSSNVNDKAVEAMSKGITTGILKTVKP